MARMPLRRGRSLALLLAGALLGASVGVATGAIPTSGSGNFYACYDGGGSVKLIDYNKTQACPKNWTGPVHWNEVGPKGDQGIQGETGATGAPGTQGLPGEQGPAGVAKANALINPTDTNGNYNLVANKSAGVLAVVHQSTGVYCFDLDFVARNVVATLTPGYPYFIGSVPGETGPGSPIWSMSDLCPQAAYQDAAVVIIGESGGSYPRQDASFSVLFN
jgi:hypothetical protein